MIELTNRENLGDDIYILYLFDSIAMLKSATLIKLENTSSIIRNFLIRCSIQKIH
jgi:hypothetical protein